ncbi:MAG: hypothetical protein ACW99A_16075 [Candidatus Kariarchaeaceae archaeon]|jgi:hypothetical protein
METKGECYTCSIGFSKQKMKNHLFSCVKKNQEIKPDNIKSGGGTTFLVRCQAKYFPHYWIYLSISEKATLTLLDKFLRKLWLECCGHLSSFSFIEGGSTISKKTNVGELFDSGLKLIHTYDFGSSTILELRVEDLIEILPNKNKIQLMSRNEFPHFTCNDCNEKAKHLCIYCHWGDEGNLCNTCLPNHNCEPTEDKDDYIVPMDVNSPRFGVCGPLEID